jgi:hypothetical protein
MLEVVVITYCMMNKKESLDELKFMTGTDRGKSKVKFTLEHVMKALKGSRCMVLLFNPLAPDFF